MLQKEFMARVERLENILDDAKLENYTVQNPDGQITETARQILTLAKWILVAGSSETRTIDWLDVGAGFMPARRPLGRAGLLSGRAGIKPAVATKQLVGKPNCPRIC